MNVPEFHDADEVAEESYIARYGWQEQPTLCDCGEVAEPGFPYCSVCLDRIDSVMKNAAYLLKHHTGFSEDETEQAIVYWIENMDKFEVKNDG